MSKEPFAKVVSHAVVLPMANIDTDQIIPARFLTVTVREGLGSKAFVDLRYNADGSPKPNFPLNLPQATGARILVAGDNFGCGSSREHAPWALKDCGFQVVISTSFADIFRGNSMKNGLLPVVVPQAFLDRLLVDDHQPIAVDLTTQTVTLHDGSQVSFQTEVFARYCMLQGIDELDFLLRHQDAVAKFEAGNL